MRMQSDVRLEMSNYSIYSIKKKRDTGVYNKLRTALDIINDPVKAFEPGLSKWEVKSFVCLYWKIFSELYSLTLVDKMA